VGYYAFFGIIKKCNTWRGRLKRKAELSISESMYMKNDCKNQVFSKRIRNCRMHLLSQGISCKLVERIYQIERKVKKRKNERLNER
jgi:hypothetical protein